MMVNHVFCSIFFLKVSRIAESIEFVSHMVKTGACSALLQGWKHPANNNHKPSSIGKKGTNHITVSQLSIDLT